MRAGGGVGVVTGWKLVPDVMTMYNLEIQKWGINDTPHPWDPNTGLSSPSAPGGP